MNCFNIVYLTRNSKICNYILTHTNIRVCVCVHIFVIRIYICREACTSVGMAKFATPLDLEDKIIVDLIVVGSTAGACVCVIVCV